MSNEGDLLIDVTIAILVYAVIPVGYYLYIQCTTIFNGKKAELVRLYLVAIIDIFDFVTDILSANELFEYSCGVTSCTSAVSGVDFHDYGTALLIVACFGGLITIVKNIMLFRYIKNGNDTNEDQRNCFTYGLDFSKFMIEDIPAVTIYLLIYGRDSTLPTTITFISVTMSVVDGFVAPIGMFLHFRANGDMCGDSQNGCKSRIGCCGKHMIGVISVIYYVVAVTTLSLVGANAYYLQSTYSVLSISQESLSDQCYVTDGTNTDWSSQYFSYFDYIYENTSMVFANVQSMIDMSEINKEEVPNIKLYWDCIMYDNTTSIGYQVIPFQACTNVYVNVTNVNDNCHNIKSSFVAVCYDACLG